MKQSKLKQFIKEEIRKVLMKEIDLSTLKVGQSININSPSELAPFNLKLSSTGQAISDIPELKGMVFNYAGKTLTRTVDRSDNKVFFKRRESNPLSDSDSNKISYKNPELLKQFTSEGGRILPRRITKHVK
jgi:ribosomal protein S18